MGDAGECSTSQSLEKRLRLEVGGVESLGKALVDGGQQLPRLARLALSVPQARETHRGPQLPGQRALTTRPLERLPEVILGDRGRVRSIVQQNERALQAQQFGDDPALLGRVQLCERLVGDGEAPDGGRAGEAFRHRGKKRRVVLHVPRAAELVDGGSSIGTPVPSSSRLISSMPLKQRPYVCHTSAPSRAA